MHRIVVFYEQAPEAAGYAEHAALCSQAPNGVFRHGKVTGSPMGEPRHAYVAEWEFADQDAFDAFVASELFMECGKDAYARGFPKPFAEFVELS
jgi:hypothetical protein